MKRIVDRDQRAIGIVNTFTPAMKPKGKTIALLAGVVVLIALVTTAWLYRAHIRFWWLFEAMGRNEQGLPAAHVVRWRIQTARDWG